MGVRMKPTDSARLAVGHVWGARGKPLKRLEDIRAGLHRAEARC
jgi:hypothetical protein